MQPKTLEIVAWVGLDWADEQHEVRLQAVGSREVQSFVLPQRPEAVKAWLSQLRARFPHGQVALALEQARGALIYALMNYDFLLLYPVPPQSLARYRQAFYPSGSKSDPQDADLLLELVRSHRDRLRVWQPEDALTRQLRLLVEHRRKLIADRTRLTNRLTSLLKESFPQALEWAGPLGSLEASEFFAQWTSLAAAQQAGRSQLRHFYLAHGERDPRRPEERLNQIRQAQPLTSDLALLETSALMVSILAGQLRALLPAHERLETAIAQLFSQHPDHGLWESFPGAGQALAPRLLVAFGSDRTRFQNAGEAQQFSGIAPVIERSGKICWVHWRWACPKFLRQSFHEFAAHTIPSSGWAKAYYLQQRSRGLGHHAALRALAFKWLRILYRCWQSRTPYDERLYLKALARRGSPLKLTLSVPPN
jgi:transposase